MERRMRVKCPKCGMEGTLTKRLTISDGKRYFYYYVQHVQTVEGKTKRIWHYYGKLEDTIHKNIESYTQSNNKDKNLNSGSNEQNNRISQWAGSLARLGHPLDVRKVTGSNPVRPTMCFCVVRLCKKVY